MAAPSPPIGALRVLLCLLLAPVRGIQLLDDAVGLVQSSQQWHSWNNVGLSPQDAEDAGSGPSSQQVEWHSFNSVGLVEPQAREGATIADQGTASIDRSTVIDDLSNDESPRSQVQWHSFDGVGFAPQATEGAIIADQGAASIDRSSVIDDLRNEESPRRQVQQWHSFNGVGFAPQATEGTALIDEGSVASTAAPVLDEKEAVEEAQPEAPALGAIGAARRSRVSTRAVSDAVARIAQEAKSRAAAKVKAQALEERSRSDTLAASNATLGQWAQKWRKEGYASWADWKAHKKDRKKQLQALGSLFSDKDADEAAAAVENLAWPARERLPKPAIITMLNRARLGNRLFQWSAMLAIAKEAGARVAAPANGRYTPTSTPQIANLEELIWSGEEMDWLNEQPNKCHMWDRDTLTLDLDLGKLQNWTLANVPKGEAHIKAARQPRKGENWARLWADAILDTPNPSSSTGKCDVVELDGFWQRAEFFVHHLDWLRPTFWNAETAGVAKETLDGWLSETGAVGAVVGVHLRLGDYIGMGRNLNMDYYRNGLLEVKRNRNVDELTCVIFSDDVNLAREVAEELESCTKRIPVYPCADLKQGTHCWASQRIVTDKVSFYMMSLMPNIIIADSTYSFWAAVLAPNKPMVVTPRVVEPERIARRGDYSYLDSELYGWWGVNASLGNHTSKAVQKALEEKLKLDQRAPSRWLVAGEKWKIMQEEEYLVQVRESEWGA